MRENMSNVREISTTRSSSASRWVSEAPVITRSLSEKIATTHTMRVCLRSASVYSVDEWLSCACASAWNHTQYLRKDLEFTSHRRIACERTRMRDIFVVLSVLWKRQQRADRDSERVRCCTAGQHGATIVAFT